MLLQEHHSRVQPFREVEDLTEGKRVLMEIASGRLGRARVMTEDGM